LNQLISVVLGWSRSCRYCYGIVFGWSMSCWCWRFMLLLSSFDVSKWRMEAKGEWEHGEG
jgi:hypothetical protein